MDADDFAYQVTAIAALAEPARRELYRFVIDQAEPVTRDAAASALSMPRHTAKFHLDRLVEDGLLEADFKRLTGRTGPGAGRPTKRYRRAQQQLSVSLPPRRYDLAGDLMATAIERVTRTGEAIGSALATTAQARGAELGQQARGPSATADLCAALARLGFEPQRTEPNRIELANCPFHSLTVDHSALVCGMNLAFISAAVKAAEVPGQARRQPLPGHCCVVITD